MSKCNLAALEIQSHEAQVLVSSFDLDPNKLQVAALAPCRITFNIPPPGQARADPAEVLALEIKQYVGENQKTLIPRLYGQTIKAQIKKDPSKIRKQWDEPSFLSELFRREGQPAVDVAKSLIVWAKTNNLWLWFGKGRRNGSCYPMFEYNEEEFYTFAIWTYGSIEFQFQHIRKQPIFDDIQKRLQLLEKLNSIPGVLIDKDGAELRPSIPLSVLETESSLNKFLRIWEAYLDEIREEYTVET